MNKKIFIASKNKGKILEIRTIINHLGFEVFSLLDTPDIDDIPETGNTFEENAFIKAKSVYDIVKIPVLADDSGLEVDLLNGAPGVYSARFSGEDANDKKNNELLLNKLGDAVFKDRTARFKCVLVYYDGVNKRTFEGTCEGNIITYEKGNNGFGYDPLFIPIGFAQTFGELDHEVKNKISHRSKALQSFIKFIELEKIV